MSLRVRALGLAAIIAVLSSSGLGAAARTQASPWSKQEPLPTPYGMQDVDMVSRTEGWGVSAPITGDHGYIFHTTTGGRTWRPQGEIFRALEAVSFSDATHGVALGNEQRYTTNGGQTWLSGSGYLGTLYDVDMVDDEVGYATGFGVVVKTVDGGLTWALQAIPLEGNLVGVDFVNRSTGWVVGDEGSVYRTTNGGSTWVRQRHDSPRFYTGVSFVSSSEGWVSGNDTILHTTNGGSTWVPQPIPPGADATEVRFVDANTGWAAGALRTILHTVDGGETWDLQLGGVFEDADNRYPFFGLDAVDTSTAVAVGIGTSIFTTTNGGASWHSRGSGSPTLPFRMARTDANHLWTANSNSEVLYTTNGGRKWERSIIQVSISCDRCSNTADIVFLNNKVGWAVINGEFTSTSWVWRTVDGGRNWQSLNITHTGPLSGLALVNPRTLVAVSGIDDLIYRSTNGGRTWVAVPHPRGGTWFGSVRFVPGTDTGWTVGEGGKILKSVDGGATWTRQRNASHVFNLIDVSFADVNNGWTVGGEELHTTDGGQTWVKQDAGVFASVSVYALSPTEAWVGGLGSMARTTTGGASWSIESPSATDWFTMSFLDIDNGWAGGQDQTIDDVPGSIWKREGSISVGGRVGARTSRAGLPVTSAGIWLAPPSAPRQR